MEVFVTITAMQGARKPLTVPPGATPTELRKQVSEVTQIPLDKLRLIYRGKMIKDDDSKKVVDEYSLEEACVIHCMGKPDAAAMASQAAPAPAATSSTASSVPAAASSESGSSDALKTAIDALRQSNAPSTYLTAITTLDKIMNNIITNPMEDKYRRVKKQNATFQKRLGGLPGGDAAMKAAGFVVRPVDGEDSYVIEATAEAWPKLTESKAKVEQAVKDAKQASAVPSTGIPRTGGSGAAANPFGMGGAAFGSGGMGGTGNPAMNDPYMRNAMANMMSNPEALRNMLQNPMVQQMIQNDPNIPPMMRQSMQQIASNPAMLDQLSQMMNNPAMRAQMESAMAGSGMPQFPGMPAFPPANLQQQQQQQPGGAGGDTNAANNEGNQGSDQDQTEEEMIAEAIRRSMNER